jgi:hypothetical protein
LFLQNARILSEKYRNLPTGLVAREDWTFWIAMLKDGGKVVTLSRVSVYYRVRTGSKRVSDRSLKRKLIDALNARHPEFFERVDNAFIELKPPTPAG